MVFTEKGFCSTSIDPNIFATTPGSTCLRIYVPKGSKGAYVANLSRYKREHELLLQNGSSFKIVNSVVDDYGNIALVLSPGIGGGLGSSVGLGSTAYPGIIDVNTIAGVATKVGGSIICLGFEMDDKGSYSATIWRPKLGADFHATINYSWVIILWDGEKS